ncbi:MAG: hypothetical protein IJ583_02075 [Firmicutes bacterium]|nr:hypothetical protein [Bacillota bacterium]
MTEIERLELVNRKEKAESMGRDTVIKYFDSYLDICRKITPNVTKHELELFKTLIYRGIGDIYKGDTSDIDMGVIWKYIDCCDWKAVCVAVDIFYEKKWKEGKKNEY